MDRRGLSEVAHQHYGLNQADRPRLAEVVEEEFGGEPLDLVIDDASHLYEESRATFEVLYPHLRPGGAYVLEDWRWQHMVATSTDHPERMSEKAKAAIVQRMIDVSEGRAGLVVPMSRLVLELVLIRAALPGVITELVIDQHWATVTRGPDVLDPATFALDSIFRDHYQLLTPTP